MEFNKPDPLQMTGNLAENFRNFRYQLQMYFNATECHSKEEATQVAILLDLLGSDGLKIYNTLKIPSITVFEILKALEAYCIPPRRNETMQQYKFFTRKQLDGEPFNKYYADLRELVKSCELNTCDKLLKIQIILGISDKELQARLLRDELTLEKTVKHCQIVEESKVNRKRIQENTKKLLNIEAEQHKGSNQYSRGVNSNFRKPTQHKQSNGKGDGKYQNIMEKHIDLQHKNIKIEMEDNNEEEFTDIGYNIDKNKHKNTNFRNVSVNKETNSIVKTEKDETVFNDCVFESKIEIEMAHATDPIENCNNPNPTENETNTIIETEQDETVFNDCVFDSEIEIEMAHATYPIENCNNPNPTEHEMEIGIENEYKNDEMYNCAKCSLVFHDRPSIIDHLNPHIDQCINCCKYIGSPTSCKYPVSFHPRTSFYFECEECYNGFYTLKSFERYLSAQSNKKTDRPYKCDICLKTYIHLYHFAAHQRLHKGERPYQCNICNKFFHAKFNLEAHMFSHQIVKRYECSLCSKKFLKLKYFKIHMLSHDSYIHKCKKCGEEFRSLNLLQNHQDLHPRYRPYKCIPCGKSFSRHNSLTQHLKRHEGLKPYQCTQCDESFSTCFNFNCHKRLHKGEKPYECDICGDQFIQLTDWKKHKKLHIENKNFECNECHKKFASKKYVSNHLQRHVEKNYKCKVCNKYFNEIRILNEHKKIHKDFKPYVCNICKKGFISRYNYSHHLNQHTGARPFVCDLCGKAFPSLIALNRHKKTNHTCFICNKFFNDPKELNVHKITHEEFKLKQYACKLCDKSFKNQLTLDRHQVTHQVEKPFKCDFCPKAFIRTSCLVLHRRKHTGERPFKCDLCKKTYPRFGSLTRHEAIVHNK